jgi:hypothetical protein
VGLYVSSYIKMQPLKTKFNSMQILLNDDILGRFVVEVELNQFSLIPSGFFEEKLSLIDLLLESYVNNESELFDEIFRWGYFTNDLCRMKLLKCQVMRSKGDKNDVVKECEKQIENLEGLSSIKCNKIDNLKALFNCELGISKNECGEYQSFYFTIAMGLWNDIFANINHYNPAAKTVKPPIDEKALIELLKYFDFLGNYFSLIKESKLSIIVSYIHLQAFSCYSNITNESIFSLTFRSGINLFAVSYFIP